MSRNFKLALALVGTVILLVGGSAVASDHPLTGTWHQRDFGHSNIFYFIDEPVGGVFPVLFFDDATGDLVCGDNGWMMASGFVNETGEDDGTVIYEGSLGSYWCPDNGDGEIAERPSEVIPSPWPLSIEFGTELRYHSDTGTISGGIGVCEGFRQPKLDNPNEAVEEIAEGKYPPPVFPAPGC